MLSTLDSKTALVLIDLQNGIAHRPLAHPSADIIQNALKLLEAFRSKGLPVVIVNVNPFDSPYNHLRAEQRMIPADEAGRKKAKEAMEKADFFSIVEEIEVMPGDIRITKPGWNAFAHTSLHEQLQQSGVTGIVLGGISTSIGVESTARRANEQGYNISFATDAMTDSVAAAHDNSLRYIFPRIGELGTTEEIRTLLSV